MFDKNLGVNEESDFVKGLVAGVAAGAACFARDGTISIRLEQSD